MADLLEQARPFLPKYLSPAKTAELWTEIQAFPKNKSFYGVGTGDVLQGDGWRGFVVVAFDTLDKKTVSGLVVSNSCDISPANAHVGERAILFVPLVPLDRYRKLLIAGGRGEAAVEDSIEQIRRQQVTALFHLPPIGSMPESLAILNDIHRQPLERFQASERTMVFSLSQFGFYLFLIKFSICFMRANEGVERAALVR